MSDALALMKPSIGKRVYMVMLSKMVVVPAIVREKVIRETIDGVATSYLLDFGAPGKNRVPSTTIQDNIVVATPQGAYDALETYISENAAKWAREQIDGAHQAVAVAVQNADKRFGPIPQSEASITTKSNNVDEIAIEFDDFGDDNEEMDAMMDAIASRQGLVENSVPPPVPANENIVPNNDIKTAK